MAPTENELETQRRDSDREIPDINVTLELIVGGHRGVLSCDPIGDEEGVRAKKSRCRRGQLGGNLNGVIAFKELRRELLAPEGVASNALANAARGLRREPVHCRGGGVNREKFRLRSFRFYRARESSFGRRKRFTLALRAVGARSLEITARGGSALRGAFARSSAELTRRSQVPRDSRVAKNQEALNR